VTPPGIIGRYASDRLPQWEQKRFIRAEWWSVNRAGERTIALRIGRLRRPRNADMPGWKAMLVGECATGDKRGDATNTLSLYAVARSPVKT
jgi:hypothetical protein